MVSKQQFLNNLDVIRQDIEKLSEEEFQLMFRKSDKKSNYQNKVENIDIKSFDEIKTKIEKASSKECAMEILDTSEILNTKYKLIEFAKNYSIAVNMKDKKEEIKNLILRRLYDGKKQREVISNLDL